MAKEAGGIRVLGDAAQAHGATLGGRPIASLADATAYSFYPTKNLGGVGDGGAVVTDDSELATALRQLRNYGSSDKYRHEVLGVNSRLDEIQAAFLRVKLAKLGSWVEHRRHLAERYRLGLRGLAGLRLLDDDAAADEVHHIFPAFCDQRDALRDHLSANGIETLIHYPEPPHRAGAFSDLDFTPSQFPVAENVSATEISLPLHEDLGDDEVDRIVQAIHNFFA
jgi:dTDP-3-amino-3,4,6-trideoxy-alpha-D-glucose transaminase